MPRYGFDFQALPGHRRGQRRVFDYDRQAYVRVANSLGTINRVTRAARRARLARDGLYAAGRAFLTAGAADIGRRAYNALTSDSSDPSVHWSDSDTGFPGPSGPIPPPLTGPAYLQHRPTRLDLTSTQRYRDWPSTDPPARTFGASPNWLRYSSSTPLSGFSQFGGSLTQPSNSLSPRIRRLRARSPNQVARLENTLRWFKTRLILRARSRRAGRSKTRLASSLRQASRRVLHLRKKYIIVPARWKPRVRRALAKALRTRYIARRRFRNA